LYRVNGVWRFLDVSLSWYCRRSLISDNSRACIWTNCPSSKTSYVGRCRVFRGRCQPSTPRRTHYDDRRRRPRRVCQTRAVDVVEECSQALVRRSHDECLTRRWIDFAVGELTCMPLCTRSYYTFCWWLRLTALYVTPWLCAVCLMLIARVGYL